MTEVEEAIQAFIGAVRKIYDTETAELALSGGRILSSPVTAPFSVPSFPKSAMDGYAVHASETKGASEECPLVVPVAGEVLAGEPLTVRQGISVGAPLSAVRIMTGARVPEGYDAVVRQEDTDYGEKEVRIRKELQPFTNVCRVGEDIREGEEVLPRGRRIGRIEMGVLASLGIARIEVLRPLHAVILSTGSELCEVGEELREGAIYNSIAYTLGESMRQAGFTFCTKICRDHEEEIIDALDAALQEADVVITTGGVSVGKKDLLPDVLKKIGAEVLFSGVNIQPGTPTIGSVKDGVPILSLSGNPYAALVNFDLYFWPLAVKLTGSDAFQPMEEEMVARSDYEKTNRLRRMLRAKAENGGVTLPVKSHASSVLSNLLDCNGYIDLPAGTSFRKGDSVRVIRMPEW